MAVPLVLASSLHALGRVADAEAMLCDGLAVGPPGRGRAVALQCRPPTSHHNLIILCYGRMIIIFGASLAEAADRTLGGPALAAARRPVAAVGHRLRARAARSRRRAEL